jgi:hypothetical protein
MAAIYHIVPQNASQIGKTPLCGINTGSRPPCFMPPRQAALRRQALVMAVAFPHHAVQEKVQEKTAPDAPGEIRRARCANRKSGERRGGE